MAPDLKDPSIDLAHPEEILKPLCQVVLSSELSLSAYCYENDSKKTAECVRTLGIVLQSLWTAWNRRIICPSR